jgi:hypothetical protein
LFVVVVVCCVVGLVFVVCLFGVVSIFESFPHDKRSYSVAHSIQIRKQEEFAILYLSSTFLAHQII